MNRKSFRIGWLVSVVMLTALACTCGPLAQATQGIETVQAVASQAQGLVTQAQGLATEGVALATQLEESGMFETANAAYTELAGVDGYQTALAITTQVSDEPTPEDIPLYPQNTAVLNFGEAFGYAALADIPTVTEFYKTEMPNNGWELAEDPIESEQSAILVYTKGDRRTTITMSPGEGFTTVGVQLIP
jgi:hypothetical protein